MMKNKLAFVEAKLDTFIRSDRKRIDCMKAIEAIVFLSNNIRYSEFETPKGNGFSLQDILGDIYLNMDNKDREILNNIFLEEVELSYLGIKCVNEDRFKVIGDTKLSKNEGQEPEILAKILKMIEDINVGDTNGLGIIVYELIKYIHAIKFIGDDFTLPTIIQKDNWESINLQKRSELGFVFSQVASSQQYGIKHLFTSGGIEKKDHSGRNMYIKTNFS
jgi:hypothetical protein